MIEAKAYGSDCTTEERQAITDRVFLYRDNIIMYREMPVQSIFHLSLFKEKLEELVSNLDSYYIIVDLTEAKLPTAEIRAYLKTFFPKLEGLSCLVTFTGRNEFINFSAKFVSNSFGLKAFKIHKTFEQAIESVENLKKEIEDGSQQ